MREFAAAALFLYTTVSVGVFRREISGTSKDLIRLQDLIKYVARG